MRTESLLIATVYICRVLAAQPTAPEPLPAPLRDLKFGDLNFLHTTDTHGWHAGHLLEASYSADWGDYIDFAGRLREKAEANGQDLLVIDTGDRIEGNGLYDGDDPKGNHTFKIFTEQHIDIICTGNHELYKQNSSENELYITVPAYRDAYVASNLDIYSAEEGDFIPLAPRYKKFTTKKQGIRIMSFGFIFDFAGNYKNTKVQPVENTIKEQWFQNAIRDPDIDLFVVIGHVTARSDEFTWIYQAIREVQPDLPIQFFGGHLHVRDYKKFDSKSYALASGRFMETIGFQSISGIKEPGMTSKSSSPTFFRRYIDNNLYSFYHHSGQNISTFHSEHGQAVSKMIAASRSELGLDVVYGCVPRDLWMSRAPYPDSSSIYTWLDQRVLPEMVIEPKRADKPRLILTNTGAIRFDIFKGAFTRDSTFIVSPFTSGFRYIKDVPYSTAIKVLPILNGEGQIFTSSTRDPDLELWKLAPPEQHAYTNRPHLAHHNFPHSQPDQHPLTVQSSDPKIFPGYTTTDDLDTQGDDTIHSPITFYRVPNVVQSQVTPPSSLANSQTPPSTIDLVFNEFLQPYILAVLQNLGSNYTEEHTSPYVEGENLTNLISKWVSENWGGKC